MPRRKLLTPMKVVCNQIENNSDDNNIIPKKRRKVKHKKLCTYTIVKSGKETEPFYFGQICIGYLEEKTNIPNEWNKCKVTFDENMIQFCFAEDIIHVSVLEINFFKDIFSSQIFNFRFDISSADTKSLVLLLYFRQIPLPKFNTRIGQLMKRLVNDFFSIQSDTFENSNTQMHENVDDFYANVKDYAKHVLPQNNVQHVSLLPELRPYQANAIRWMIQREQSTTITESLSQLYVPIQLNSGVEIYYNKYIGTIEKTKPLIRYSQSGGILADEMGLGKTVEILACILNNPRILIENENDNDDDDDVVIEAEEEEEADKSMPIIETQLKTKQQTSFKKKKKEKKQKLDVILKDKKSKSATRIAAQMWYESKLAEMQINRVITTPSPLRSELQLECICGEFTRKGVIVTCCDCRKMQHALCMGYKNKEKKYYSCPQCWINKSPIKSKATLIVSPATISKQWSLEVQRHIQSKGGLKVLEYKGIHSAGFMYPSDLAEYDLVITTYNVLQSELKFITPETNSSRQLRNVKRYNSPTTPLLFIEWWRLCLDEAQMVECPSSQVACMSRQLNAVHRWAITGTPIQKHIGDLYGLIDYLQIEPYNDTATWNYVLYLPYMNGDKEPMFRFLSDILWRSVKSDVIDQICIPEQTFEESWIEFSAVEKFFYKREHESCAKEFLTKLESFQSLDIPLCSIDRHTLNVILTPLLSLRQVCTHPLAVRGRYLATKRQVNSMENLLDALIKRNSKDCDESLRAVLAALNGMAGILLLQQETLLAVEKYREALQYMSKYDNSDFIKIDKLQRIHTLHNLNEVLKDETSPKPPPTLRDDQLKDEVEQIQHQYMNKYITQTVNAYKDAQSATNIVKGLLKKLVMNEGECFAELFDSVAINSLEDELVKRITNNLSDTSLNKCEQLTNKSIMYLITTWIDKIAKNYKDLQKSMQNFGTSSGSISEEIVNDAMECHLRPLKTVKRALCACCLLDNKLKKYECILFQMKTKESKESNKGNWHPCFEEKLLKTIYQFCKSKLIDDGDNRNLLGDAETHIALCEARRKEFKELRKLYTFYDQQVSAQDELNICKVRFRLRNVDEPVQVIHKKRNNVLKNLDYEIENPFEFINMLDYFELDYKYSLMNEEKHGNEQKLNKLIGTHGYLQVLRKQQYAGESPDPCPICRAQLTDTWSILPCGHCYCLDCIHKLLERYLFGKQVECSVCRKRNSCDDISYIKVNGGNNAVDMGVVKGSHSTKVHAVLRCVLNLLRSDSDVKILIFSTWQPVLQVLSEAFTMNDIGHELITSTHKLHEKLQKFKQNENKNALLLPLRLGAKGLNLIEATHVLLVEPLMNPADELQAIGRVHRIGQNKPTVVHRFLIKNTIEENIYNAVSSNTQQWHENKLTFAQLKHLFANNEKE